MKKGFTASEMKALSRIAEKQQEKLKGGRFWRRLEFCVSLLILIVFAVGVRHFVAEPVRVVGDSMHPTLAEGDLMLVEKLTYWTEEPSRGDIIVCYYPGYTVSCVKRVIAVGGETVEIKDGEVYIDGAILDEAAYWNGTHFGSMEEVTVPEGSVFVMGDNRNNSKDSRNVTVGPIPFEKIVGRVFFSF